MKHPVTLLIVEDDRELLELLASKARAQEYDVFSAASVGEALRALDSDAVQVALVDLALGAESGLDNRKELATELGYTGAKDGSAEMNIWLHKAVMKKLEENGGKVSADLKD
jgi:CheY-like chemotaxis protein